MFRAVVLFALACLAWPARAADVAVEPQQEVPFATLFMLKSYGFTLRHSSLDGLPPVPESGVTFNLHCRIDDGRLADCNAACGCTAAEEVFLPAALKRAAAVRLAPSARNGTPVSGMRTTFVVRITPADRFDNSAVDFSHGDQIAFSATPKGRDLELYYPRRAIERDLEARVDMVCTVQAGLTVECPDIRVTLNTTDADMIDEFRQAATNIAKIYRVAPRTTDDRDSVGLGVRQRILFQLR